MIQTRLKARLLDHEGLWLKPYLDMVGKITIGVGRNLDDVGISKEEAYFLLNTDIQHAIAGAYRSLDNFDGLNSIRQEVVVEMVFQLGMKGFQTFRKAIAAINAGDFNKAADEMLDSKWAQQTPNRARELADLMRAGDSEEGG